MPSQNKASTFKLWYELYSAFILMTAFGSVIISVAQLSPELRKLLRWKMSSITPNVIKQCIARVGFKPTKSKFFMCNGNIN